MAALEITADRAACRGARACARRAPATFSLDAQRRVVIARAPGDGAEAIVAAARACPNFALAVWRGGEKLA
ncbi:MAG TPA: (4Fe-4S)-binding protein [Myxococcota bacterium]|jgi:ferredoxin